MLRRIVGQHIALGWPQKSSNEARQCNDGHHHNHRGSSHTDVANNEQGSNEKEVSQGSDWQRGSSTHSMNYSWSNLISKKHATIEGGQCIESEISQPNFFDIQRRRILDLLKRCKEQGHPKAKPERTHCIGKLPGLDLSHLWLATKMRRWILQQFVNPNCMVLH